MRQESLPHPSLPALQSGSRLLRLLSLHGPVAQSGERRPRMAEARGSSPLGSTLFFFRFAGKIWRTRNRGQCYQRPLCSNRAATHLAYLSLSWSEWDYPLPVVYLPPILLVEPTDEPRRAEHRNVDREVSHCRLQASSAASVDLAYVDQGYTAERPAEEAQAHATSLEVAIPSPCV